MGIGTLLTLPGPPGMAVSCSPHLQRTPVLFSTNADLRQVKSSSQPKGHGAVLKFLGIEAGALELNLKQDSKFSMDLPDI